MDVRLGPGVPDEAFSRGDVPMSKMEVRAITIAKARIACGMRVLDVGAGTGALTVDAALAAAGGEVFAIERNAEAVELLRANLSRLTPGSVSVVEGEAPDAFSQLDGAFDAVLVGGSGGRLSEIVAALPTLVAPGGRVVVNAIGIRSMQVALDALSAEPWAASECVQVSVSRAEKLGRDLRFVPLNPVWIVSATLGEAGPESAEVAR
jgi:cobalt-precorrin-6B (C15)-methyltransferase